MIIPSSGETAEDIARASVVGMSGIILGGDLNVLFPRIFLHSTFLALSLSSGKRKKELAKKARGNSIVHLHNSDIKEVTVQYPTKKEQVQISGIFHKIETLITLHQRAFILYNY